MKNIKKIKGIAISLVTETGGGRTLSLAFALGLAFLLAAPGALAQDNAKPVAVDDAYTISSDIDAANRGTRRVVFTAGNVITGDSNSANAGGGHG